MALSRNTISKYFSNPKGNLRLLCIKIISDHRSILIEIYSSPMLPLLVKLVTNGLLVVKIQDNNQGMAFNYLNITLMDKILMEKIHGGNEALVGTLMLAPIRGL